MIRSGFFPTKLQESYASYKVNLQVAKFQYSVYNNFALPSESNKIIA
jgi:hypothetical protein